MVTKDRCASPNSIERLMQAKRGDEAAIQDLYLHHRTQVFRYLFYQLGEAQVVEDLTSEVFVRMLRALPTYQPRGSFQAWLYQIAHNVLVDHYRKEKGHLRLALNEDLVAEGEDPSETVDDLLDSQALRKALGLLNDAQREVMIMRFILGLPIQQVAQALSTSEDAVKGLQYRALVSLRQILKDRG